MCIKVFEIAPAGGGRGGKYCDGVVALLVDRAGVKVAYAVAAAAVVCDSFEFGVDKGLAGCAKLPF